MEKVATVSKRSTSSLPKIIRDYKDAMANGDRYYIAAKFEREKEQVPRKFVLGDGGTYGGYKNVPLEPMTQYKVYVRAATEVNGVRDKIKIICGAIVWATSGKEGLAILFKEFSPSTPQCLLFETDLKYVQVLFGCYFFLYIDNIFHSDLLFFNMQILVYGEPAEITLPPTGRFLL